MIEAFAAIDLILTVAIAAAALIGAGLAFLAIAASYWTAVCAAWAVRTLAHRPRKENPQP